MIVVSPRDRAPIDQPVAGFYRAKHYTNADRFVQISGAHGNGLGLSLSTFACVVKVGAGTVTISDAEESPSFIVGIRLQVAGTARFVGGSEQPPLGIVCPC